MNARLDIRLAGTAPDTYRQQFLKLPFDDRRAHLQSLDAEGLRAHTQATGEPPTWWLHLTLDQDFAPHEVECGIAGNRRKVRFEPGMSLEAWFRPQFDFIRKAGCVSGPCGVSLPDQFQLDQTRSGLLKILGDSLPAAGWHPSRITLNTVGYSDRGEPPDPSTSMRVLGKVRWPAFGWMDNVQFQSTVSMLLPMDPNGWRALLSLIAGDLGLRLEEN